MDRSGIPLYFSLPLGGGGLVLLMFTLLKTGGLSLGSLGDREALVFVLAGLAVLALGILAAENYGPEVIWACLLPVALALFVRVLCLDHITQDYELFLSRWAEAFRAGGGFDAVKENIGNYNAPYLYFLAAISYLKFPDLYAIKLFSILFDFLLAWGGLRLCRVFFPGDSLRPAAAFCVLLLLPTVILNGAYWGQCDSVYAAFVLHALASALDKKSASSVLLLSVAFSFKLQTVFLIPLWCALWFGGRIKFRHLLLFPVGYAATILPALALGKPLGDILGVYVGQMGEYADRLTLNAPSVYSLIPYGTQADLKAAPVWGIATAFVLVLALLAFLFFRRGLLSDSAFLTAGVVLAVGIPFLLPYMHERYFFLADVLTAVWAVSDPRRIFQAAGVQAASLSAYHAYLVLAYFCPLTIGELCFPLGAEALILAAVLFSTAVILYRQFGIKWR